MPALLDLARGPDIVAGSVRERRNHLADVVLANRQADTLQTRADTAAAKETRLGEAEKRKVFEQFPSAVTEVIEAAEQLPKGSRVAFFHSQLSPALQAMKAQGLPVEDFEREIQNITEAELAPGSSEKFSATVQQGVGPDGRPTFFQAGDQGSVRTLDGVNPLPKTGERIEVGPDGQVTISRGVSQGDLSKSTTSKTEQSILEDTEILAKTRNVLGTFKPEFQTISGRFDALKSSVKAKANVELEPAEVQQLQVFADYRANTAQLQAEVINQLAGAAVSESEAKRINGFLIDPGSGIFDGDDPITAESKLKRYQRNIESAIARKKWFLSNGIQANEESWARYPLDDMAGIMKKRHGEILGELSQANPDASGSELRQQAKQQLGQEFGIL